MKSYNPIKVYRWTSSENKTIISINAFEDDKIDDAINKIGLSIQQNSAFYVWSGDKPLLFSIKNPKWKGYNVNPFKSSDYESNELLEPISYDYHTNKLFNHKTINIVFENDLPEVLKKNKYYFPNLKVQSIEQYNKRDTKLLNLTKLNIQNVKTLGQYYTRANLHTKLQFISLPDIFDTAHSSKYIDMIQLIDDTSKILYKVYKKHKISKEYFGIWTNIDKITKINVINMYSIIHKNSYCKISIDNDGNILLNYVLDHRKYIKWDDINNHKNKIIEILQNLLKTSIKLNEISLNINVKVEAQNSTLKLLSKKISEAIDIFHILSNKANVLTCTYKRSSNYSQNTDIYDYIKARIYLGVSKQEIIEELMNLGISGNLENMVSNEIDMILNNQTNTDNTLNIKLQDNGTIVVIKPYSNGYDLSIINCPNNTEYNYLIYWITRIISTSIGKPLPLPKTQLKPKTPSPKTPSTKSEKSDKSSSSSSSIDDSSIDFDDIESLGGAPTKNNFITFLQQADKELFSENYARDKCQNNSQPIVMTKEYKEHLEKINQLHFDNIVEYGSNPNIKNFYGCPRLWCPQSKVPLSVDDPNAKCPIDNETPLQLFWDNDKNRKRYVKLIKPNEKGMCVPCCMKKEPKKDDISKCKMFDKQLHFPSPPSAINEFDENYIMNQVAPIPIGRYGSIPEYLMKILNINTEYCSKMLTKTHECIVRKGIKHTKTEGIIYSIMDILNFKTKKEFINDIKKKLDLVTFISLADGMICFQFMNMREIYDNDALLKEYKQYNKNNIFKEGNLSRNLNIFYAYKRYIEYISSDDFTAMKNPYYLYSLISSLYNIYLLVWEKIEKSNDIYLNCYHTIIDFNPTIAMIIREGTYYEPLELKTRSTTGIKLFKLNNYPKLKDLLTKCNKQHNDIETYRNVNMLNNWIKSKLLKNYKDYIIKNILINSDLTINKFLTTGNIFLESKPISISLLPNMLKDFGISKDDILFYDDIVGKEFKINILKDDLNLFAQKSSEFYVKFNMGKIQIDEKFEYYTTLVLQPDKMMNSMIIHTNNKNNTFYNNLSVVQNKSKKWFELQKMVANTLIKKYSKDNNLNKLNNINDRLEKLKKLQELFTDIPDKKKIKTILEQIPTDSIESIKKWLTNVIIFSKYDYYKDIPIENKNEFIFSQNAIVKNIPDNILIYHHALPNIRIKQEDYKNISQDKQSIQDTQGVISPIPSIFKGDTENLKTKWIMHKKSRWNNMVFIKCTYGKNTLNEFITWFMNYIGISGVSINDIKQITIQKYFDIMNNQELFLDILQDPQYFAKWMSKAGKKYGSVQQLWDNYYKDLSQNDRKRLTTNIIDSGLHYANDLDIMSISELLNISILLIHRGKYGKFDVSQTRGELDDLKVSSTLFPAKQNMNERPLLIFHKNYEKNNIVYNIIVDKNIPNVVNALYLKYEDVPANIKILTNAHLHDI